MIHPAAEPGLGDRAPRRALVVGASMAGLLAARVLAEHVDEVLLVERDTLDGGALPRKGVPQGQHVHGMWPRGMQALEQWLPGLGVALAEAGAPRGDVAGDICWHHFGGLKRRCRSGLDVTMASRPLLEQQVRQRVLTQPRVRLVDGCAVTGLLAAAGEAGMAPHVGGHRIVGARLQRGYGPATEVLADLVIDAAGRGGASLPWLAALGHALPDQSEVDARVSYVTRVFERRTTGNASLDDAIGHVVYPQAPGERRGAIAFAVEGGRWLLTLIGLMGERPPTDPAGFMTYARSLPLAAIGDIASQAVLSREVPMVHYPKSRRRHFERLRQPPAGHLALGDALASFDPVYGQGMTCAALQAQVLQDCLRHGLWGPRLAPAFYRLAARTVDAPWAIATGEDLRYPQAAGHRPWYLAALNAYLGAVHRAARVDAQVCTAFFQAAGLERPPASLLAPRIAWRTALGAWRVARHDDELPAAPHAGPAA